jgi:uncharacterized membrane protein
MAIGRTRLLCSIAAGVVGGVAVGVFGPPTLGPLVGCDLAATIYLGWTWLNIGHLDGGQTGRLALREDPGRGAADILLLTASVVSLAAVGLVIIAGTAKSDAARDLRAGLSVLSVALSWALVHTVFTERYARLYYRDTPGGIDFNNPAPPCYMDFAYLAFTIGMTFQVSDTDLTGKRVRRAALHHALLSYAFGTVIVAITVNSVAQLLGH